MGGVSVAFYCLMIIGLLSIPPVRFEENLAGHRQRAETFTALCLRVYYWHQEKKNKKQPPSVNEDRILPIMLMLF